MDPLVIPTPPFVLEPGYQWEMNKNFIYVFKDGRSVMTISLSEVNCALKKEK